MRRTRPVHGLPKQYIKASQILDNLFLGPMMASTNKTALKSLGITHILSVCDGAIPKFKKEFAYKIVTIYDVPTARLSPHFTACIKFIQEALASGGRVLVHCWAGVSRSATIVLAFLMRVHGMSLAEAFNYVKARRAIIFPNHGFMTQLTRYESWLAKNREKIGASP